jgi:hypothetical protein
MIDLYIYGDEVDSIFQLLDKSENSGNIDIRLQNHEKVKGYADFQIAMSRRRINPKSEKLIPLWPPN